MGGELTDGFRKQSLVAEQATLTMLNNGRAPMLMLSFRYVGFLMHRIAPCDGDIGSINRWPSGCFGAGEIDPAGICGSNPRLTVSSTALASTYRRANSSSFCSIREIKMSVSNICSATWPALQSPFGGVSLKLREEKRLIARSNWVVDSFIAGTICSEIMRQNTLITV